MRKQEIILRCHRHSATNGATGASAVARANSATAFASKPVARVDHDAAGNPGRRRLSSSPLRTKRWKFERRRTQFSIVPSSCSAVNSDGLFAIRLFWGIAPCRRKNYFASAISYHRIRWLSEQSAAGSGGDGLNHSGNSVIPTGQKRGENRDGRDNDSSATPSNQSATETVLAQLSSPPNLLTLSRILATPYLSYLLISHHSRKNSDANSAVDGGGDAAAASSPMPADAAPLDAVNASADALSVVAGISDQSSAPAVALALFLAMGLTDFLDGYVARAYPSTATVLGTYLDPIADKFFIGAMSLTLWHAGILPGTLVGLWVARDVGIVGCGCWLVRREAARKRGGRDQGDICEGSADDVTRVDPPNLPFEVQASFASKANTALQIALISLGIAGEVPWIDVPPELMTSLVWITAGTTIGSTLGYLDGSALKNFGTK